MPTVFFYFLLGFLQGLLEWLPVSSEGQIVLLAIWLKSSEVSALTLAFWLHLGTMSAVFLVYRKEWINILDFRKADPEGLRSFLIITTIGTAIIGIPVRVFLLQAVNTKSVALIAMWIIGISLIVTGLLIHFSRKTDGNRSLSELSWKEKLLVGFAQGFTIIPGISRSGTTVSILLFLKLQAKDSFQGSFLMSVPAVLGALVLDSYSYYQSGDPIIGDLNVSGVLIGIFTAFVTGYYSMKGLLFVAQKYNFSKIAISLGLFILFVTLILVY